jgi:PmbA protein
MKTEFAEKLLDIAIKGGADEAEVYAGSSRSIAIEVRDQKVDSIESSNTIGYCVRVIKDRRLGFSYSTDIKEVEKTARRALDASGYSEPDTYLGFPQEGGLSEIEVYDETVASISEDKALECALQLERSAFDADKRIRKVRKPSAVFTASHKAILNSHGVRASYSATSCSGQVMAIAEDGDESCMGWDYDGSRFFNEVSFKDVGRVAAERATSLLGAVRISPFKGFVLLDNSVVCDFLAILASALSAESVQKKKSMLAGKLNELVMSRRLNIIDDALLKGKLGSKPSDDEGVETKRKLLIEQGTLQAFMHNTYTAAKDGTSSTGNAVRGGATGMPAVGRMNLYLDAGADESRHPFNKLVETVDKGLYVLDTMGMHTANPISGEFSVGVSGLFIEKGATRYPFKEAVISGNILDLFKNVLMVGEDLRFYGNIGAPCLLIEHMDISG